MKLRNGLLVAGTIAFVAAGCAGGAGSSGGGMPSSTPAPGPSSSAASGESEREDAFTRAAQDFLDDGFAAETLGQTDEATAAFQEAVAQAEQAVQSDPTNPRAHILLGEASIEVGAYEQAGEAYAEALELRPAYIEDTRATREQVWVRLYNEGVPLINAADYAGAIEVFGAADQIYGERPEIKIILGQLLAQEQRYEEAIEVMRSAREVIESPRIEEVDTATASSWLEQSADINPTIAQSLLMLEEYGEAVPVLQALIDENPGELQYVFSLATAYTETGQTEQAIELYNEVAAQPGLGAENYLDLGLGLYRLEDYTAAAAAFGQAAEAAPYDRDALELGVNSLQLTFQGNDSIEASPEQVDAWVDMAQRWIELDPYSDRAYVALAQGLARTGDSSEAPEYLNRAESLPFNVRNLQMTRTRGGANVVGSVARRTEDAPSDLTLLFTFYDASGGVLGTETAQITLPAGEGASAGLNVTFEGEGVEGYGYELQN